MARKSVIPAKALTGTLRADTSGSGGDAFVREGATLWAEAPEGQRAVHFQWHSGSLGPIAGAQSADFTPDCDQFDRHELFCQIALASGAIAVTPKRVLRRAPPERVRELPDQVLDQDPGGDILPIAGAFRGRGLRYLLIEGRAEIDSRDGTLLVDTRQPGGPFDMVVAAQNSGGRVYTRFRVTVEPADPAALVHQTSLAVNPLSPQTGGPLRPAQATPEADIIGSTAELQHFMDSNIARTARLRPGLYDGAILVSGRPASGQRVVESLDPSQPPELRQINLAMGKGPKDRGFVAFRGLRFRNPDLDGFVALINGECAALTVENCSFTGDMGYAYQGFDWQQSQVTKGKALQSRQVYGLVFRNNVVHNLAYGMDIAGQNIRIEGCIFDSLYTDPIVLRGARDGLTRDVEIIDNEARNPAGDPSVLHYDFVQSYPGGGSGGLRRVRIAGNVVYWGPRGLRYPGNGNTRYARGVLRADHRIAPAPKGRERHLYLIDASAGPITVRLPRPSPEASRITNITLRRIDEGSAPVRVVGRGLRGTETLTRQGNTNRYTVEAGAWVESQAAPYIQGVFFQDWGAEGVAGLVVAGNILIGAATWAIAAGKGGPQTKDGAYMRHVHVMNNTCLPHWPGDADGDGNANEPHDGYHSGSAVIQTWAPAMRVERNIANHVLQSPLSGKKRAVLPGNDTFPRDDYGALSIRFAAPGAEVFAPMSRHEAVELATPPQRSRVPQGFGAAAVWDFAGGQPKMDAPKLSALPAQRFGPQFRNGWIAPVDLARFASGRDLSFYAEGLPPGLILTGGGELLGQPRRAGRWVATVTACNVAGFSNIQTLEVEIRL